MKLHRTLAGGLTPALLVAGYLLIPTAVRASEPMDSAEITKLLNDVKTEAMELRHDSEDLDTFVRSRLTWESHAGKIDMVKAHINNTGKLLTKLKAAEASGELWQQTAIQRIEPLLMELASNTEATIDHLNKNQARVHFPEFRDYVKANYELSVDLEELIRDFVGYGEAKDKLERLERKIEVTG